MRTAMFVLTPMAALALAVTPLSAQVRANVRIDIPILGRNRPVIIDRDDRYDDRRYLVEVREYSSRNHGQWKKEYRKWRPVTLYWVNGRYYERQVRGARAVTVYFYRNQYFFEPRDRDFYRYRDDHRNDRRDDRYDNRDDRNDRRDPPRPNTRYDDRARPRQ